MARVQIPSTNRETQTRRSNANNGKGGAPPPQDQTWKRHDARLVNAKLCRSNRQEMSSPVYSPVAGERS